MSEQAEIETEVVVQVAELYHESDDLIGESKEDHFEEQHHDDIEEHHHDDLIYVETAIPSEWDRYLLMPRISSFELLKQMNTFVEAKHLFLYVYASDDDFAYQTADVVNETYMKLLEQFSSDSFQLFKSSEIEM